MSDQNRKTLRSFYCLDALWSTFEQQTHEFGVSMDYLLNEAMRLYAESQGFWGAQGGFNQQNSTAPPQQVQVQTTRPARSTTGFNRPGSPQLSNPLANAPSGPPMQRAPYSGPPGQGGHPGLAQSSSIAQTVPQGQMGPNQMGPNPMGPGSMGPMGNPHGNSQLGAALGNSQLGGALGNSQMGVQPMGAQPSFGQNYQNFDAPPPPPRAGGVDGYSTMQPGSWAPGPRPAPAPAGFGSQMQAPPQPPRPQQIQSQGSPLLYLYFDNNRYTIGTEDFVIGRGSQRTDLTIRDGNISRRHCAILHRNGSHYIKDLGSTNGVEFQGNRIESKKISEGDVYYLCDYELRFSYH